MPSSDYKNAIGGGLKLKGVKDAGVDKKKKKKKPKPDADDSKALAKSEEKEDAINNGEDADEDKNAVQKALADEEKVNDVSASKWRDDEMKEYGKTEAQRRHEERRRKRVSTKFTLVGTEG